VDFETRFSLNRSRVKTRRFQALGHFDATCTAPHHVQTSSSSSGARAEAAAEAVGCDVSIPHVHPLKACLWRLKCDKSWGSVTGLGVERYTLHLERQKGLKPGHHFIGSRFETRSLSKLWVNWIQLVPAHLGEDQLRTSCDPPHASL
jgi:hypothetical protein